MNALLFDIGGTKMRVALTRDGKRFSTPRIVPTPVSFLRGMETLTRLARELTGKRLTDVAGGIAGSHDHARGLLTQSPLKGWVGKPLHAELRKRFRGARVCIENDSALVGLGEATHGAGRGSRIVAYLTISTGVGGARIVNGHIDANAYGFEPGHQIVDLHGTPCAQCGQPGDLQSFIGGRALEVQTGKPPRQIRDPRVWEAEAHALSIGLVNVAVLWSPDVIVLGGSMMKTPGIAVPRVRAFFQTHLKVFTKKPRIVRGTLGDVGGLWGAMELVKGE